MLLLQESYQDFDAFIKGVPPRLCSLSLVPILQFDHTMSTIESIHTLRTDVNAAASASGQANEAYAASLPSSAVEGFDNGVKGFQKYESVLVRSISLLMPFYLKTDLHHRVKWRKLLPTPSSKPSWTPLKTVSHDRLHTFVRETHPIFAGFKVLNEPERITTLYTLVGQANEDQLEFLVAAIQKKIQPQEEAKATREHILIIRINFPL